MNVQIVTVELVRRGSRHRTMRRLLSVCALAVLAGCAGTANGGHEVLSDDGGTTTMSTAGHDTPADPMATAPLAQSSLVVIVSNQSYNRGEVGMRIEVDGDLFVDRSFEGAGGHTFVGFPLNLATGAHAVTVTADDGTTLLVPVEVGENRRWLTVDYWSGGDQGTYIGHQVHDTQPATG